MSEQMLPRYSSLDESARARRNARPQNVHPRPTIINRLFIIEPAIRSSSLTALSYVCVCVCFYELACTKLITRASHPLGRSLLHLCMYRARNGYNHASKRVLAIRIYPYYYYVIQTQLLWFMRCTFREYNNLIVHSLLHGTSSSDKLREILHPKGFFIAAADILPFKK